MSLSFITSTLLGAVSTLSMLPGSGTGQPAAVTVLSRPWLSLSEFQLSSLLAKFFQLESLSTLSTHV